MGKTRQFDDAAKEIMALAKQRDLAKRIDALSPPDKLRLAAGMLEQRKAKLALSIIDKVSAELGTALLLQDPEFQRVRKA
jgi:hypothetical protein